MQTSFEGTWVPIISPFTGDDVDHAALTRLAQHFQASGIAGLVVGATTGEGALLRPGEQEAMFATLRTAVPGMPIVLGLSQSATQAAVEQSRRFAAQAPDGLLVTAPTYVRPTQDGIRRHFEAIVEAADLPVLAYNIPYRTGVNIEIDTLQALARDTRVVGIKECGGSVERLFRLIHETPLRVLSGDDGMNFVALCLGAHGTIAASAHIAPELHVRMGRLIREGALDTARQLAVALQPIVRDLFVEPNPAPLKALLAHQRWCANTLRLPFVPASAGLAQRLDNDWRALGAAYPACLTPSAGGALVSSPS